MGRKGRKRRKRWDAGLRADARFLSRLLLRGGAGVSRSRPGAQASGQVSSASLWAVVPRVQLPAVYVPSGGHCPFTPNTQEAWLHFPPAPPRSPSQPPVCTPCVSTGLGCGATRGWILVAVSHCAGVSGLTPDLGDTLVQHSPRDLRASQSVPVTT